jgi:hypothetical protein
MVTVPGPVADFVPVAACMGHVRVCIHAPGVGVPSHAVGSHIGATHNVLTDLVNAMASMSYRRLFVALLDWIYVWVIESTKVILWNSKHR